MSDSRTSPHAGDRLAKVIARAGVCSRRDAEAWITAGRVVVNGKVVKTPAFNVTSRDKVEIDGVALAERQGTRLWLYHKPPGLVVTEKDPEGRPTVFEALERRGLPRVLSVGRLDLTTEGLLLLTNDGGLKRVLELPETGWLRRYRVRAHGAITQAALDTLKGGIEVSGVRYGEIDATLEREQGTNVWLNLSLREGKNREVRNVLEALGLTVNRLIRVSYGPFQLGDLEPGAVEVVRTKVLRDQLGKRLAEEAEVDFESDLPEAAVPRRAPGRPVPHTQRPRGAGGGFEGRPETRRSPRGAEEGNAPPPRRIHFEGGETADFKEKPSGKGDRPARGDARPPRRDDARGNQADGSRERPARDGAVRERAFSARPDRSGDGDRRGPARPPRDGARPPRDAARPPRDFARPPRDAARPPREGGFKRNAGAGDRPATGRPQRGFDNDARPPRRDGADRPQRSGPDRAGAPGARSFEGRPARGGPGGARPSGGFGKPGGFSKPAGARSEGAPKRAFAPGSKPSGGTAGKPSGAGGPRRFPPGGKPAGAKPGGSRPSDAGPRGARPGGARPGGAKPGGAKPGGGRPGGRPTGRPQR